LPEHHRPQCRGAGARRARAQWPDSRNLGNVTHCSRNMLATALPIPVNGSGESFSSLWPSPCNAIDTTMQARPKADQAADTRSSAMTSVKLPSKKSVTAKMWMIKLARGRDSESTRPIATGSAEQGLYRSLWNVTVPRPTSIPLGVVPQVQSNASVTDCYLAARSTVSMSASGPD
jgi:hypothetical protein